jgi:endoglucanase
LEVSLLTESSHNYARYNGKIIAQDAGGPTNEQYASLLSQLATRYKNISQVAFDIMNEPHDIPSIAAWANSSQVAVNAIRQAGATNNVILIPGTDFTSATTFATKSGPALLNITNPDGTNTNLIFNVHKYLDSDGSGTHANCVTNNIDTAFQPLANFLRQNNRVAMLTETGGGPNDTSCMTMLCQQNDFIK